MVSVCARLPSWNIHCMGKSSNFKSFVALSDIVFLIIDSLLNLCCLRINLTVPPTSASGCSRETDFLRQGFILELTLDDGSIGLGEVSSSIYGMLLLD